MIIDTDRTELDNALKDSQTTVLLLVGDRTSRAAKVHQLMDARSGSWDPWHRWFLLTGPGVLTAEEERWFQEASAEHYAVVEGKNLPKKTVANGPVDDLCDSDGQPDEFRILDALQAGAAQ